VIWSPLRFVALSSARWARGFAPGVLAAGVAPTTSPPSSHWVWPPLAARHVAPFAREAARILRAEGISCDSSKTPPTVIKYRPQICLDVVTILNQNINPSPLIKVHPGPEVAHFFGGLRGGFLHGQ